MKLIEVKNEQCAWCYKMIVGGGMLIDNTGGKYHEDCVDEALEVAIETKTAQEAGETDDEPQAPALIRKL